MGEVKIVKPNILVLEYKDCKNYECPEAIFTFNLDRYELNICTCRGHCGYKWHETPNRESFLHLMSRVDKYYLLDKLFGEPNVFDYTETKDNMLNDYNVPILRRVFEKLEEVYGECFRSDEDFVGKFDEVSGAFTQYNSSDCYGHLKYRYSEHALMIVDIFMTDIRNKLKELLASENDK